MKKINKTLTVVLSIFYAVTIFLSLGYSASNTEHNCTGFDCPVCAILKLTEEISDGAKKLTSSSVCYLFSIFAVLVLFINQEMIHAAKTPVKLNDILTI